MEDEEGLVGFEGPMGEVRDAERADGCRRFVCFPASFFILLIRLFCWLFWANSSSLKEGSTRFLLGRRR